LIAVRGLLWCSSTKETNKFVNRDLNAAINILNCAKLPQRPKMLDRKFAKTKLTQKVGQILKC
jgi:transposase